MRSIQASVMGIVLVLAISIPMGWAEETPQAPQGSDQVDQVMLRYNLHPAFEKFGRGLSNFLGGWLEIPLTIDQRYTENDKAASLFTGAVYGLVRGVVRTGVGAYEAVTFFLPYPENFAPILPTLDYFKQKGKRKPLLLE